MAGSYLIKSNNIGVKPWGLVIQDLSDFKMILN
ncbi:hypothetical protein COLO4_18313 [Corchorus olitorius]|uniref:Uncharacterized protein n=1 Tax=Corchorus olitorius TaxID=93759 RepID=A0A1R3J9K3_9ROSI|nr:hypothetical protein COLO4_18313 [Corchorus olitorius]